MIIAKQVSCQRGYEPLFEPVSFDLDLGQALLISGPNGIGKTTLLESIAGLRSIQSGQLIYNNHDLNHEKDQWFDNSFYIGHKTGHKKAMTCLENLSSFLQIQGCKASIAAIEKALEEVGLAGYEYQMSGSLSAGQKKRLALARLLLIDHAIWIIDEPFVNLDITGCEWLLTLLKQHLDNSGMLIITAHDNPLIQNIVTQNIELKAFI